MPISEGLYRKFRDAGFGHRASVILSDPEETSVEWAGSGFGYNPSTGQFLGMPTYVLVTDYTVPGATFASAPSYADLAWSATPQSAADFASTADNMNVVVAPGTYLVTTWGVVSHTDYVTRPEGMIGCSMPGGTATQTPLLTSLSLDEDQGQPSATWNLTSIALQPEGGTTDSIHLYLSGTTPLQVGTATLTITKLL